MNKQIQYTQIDITPDEVKEYYKRITGLNVDEDIIESKQISTITIMFIKIDGELRLYIETV